MTVNTASWQRWQSQQYSAVYQTCYLMWVMQSGLQQGVAPGGVMTASCQGHFTPGRPLWHPQEPPHFCSRLEHDGAKPGNEVLAGFGPLFMAVFFLLGLC